MERMGAVGVGNGGCVEEGEGLRGGVEGGDRVVAGVGEGDDGGVVEAVEEEIWVAAEGSWGGLGEVEGVGDLESGVVAC